MEYDYKNEILIDESSLDTEWRDHPSLVLKYTEARADAQRDLDIAEEALDLLVAKTDKRIREDSDKKPSEKQIEHMITLDGKVQEARERVIEAKYNLSLLQGACYAFDNRRTALEALVKLFGMNYFAEPTADIEMRGSIRQMTKTASKEKVKINMKRDKDEEDGAPPMVRRK